MYTRILLYILEDMRNHVFRAWTKQKSDGEYIVTEDGHPAIRMDLREEDEGQCRMEFLCLTEEISKNIRL